MCWETGNGVTVWTLLPPLQRCEPGWQWLGIKWCPAASCKGPYWIKWAPPCWLHSQFHANTFNPTDSAATATPSLYDKHWSQISLPGLYDQHWADQLARSANQVCIFNIGLWSANQVCMINIGLWSASQVCMINIGHCDQLAISLPDVTDVFLHRTIWESFINGNSLKIVRPFQKIWHWLVEPQVVQIVSLFYGA